MDLCADWADEADLPESCDTAAVKPGVLTDAFTLASRVLYELTGRRWSGVCTDTVRPCRSARGSCDRCGYGTSTVELPNKPIVGITQVLIDGAVVDPDDYRIDDNGWLVARRRADGTRRTWPCCQDLSRATTETGTFAVTFTYGVDPPTEAVRMCARLAWEFAVSWTPNCTVACQLPQRVQTITRAGVSMTLLDPLTLFDEGKTGITDIDLWLAALRYGETRGRTAFVDMARAPIATRTTWTAPPIPT